MKKILIAGASVYGLNNLSDDSMFSVFCRELHKNIENLDLVLLARHPGKELDEEFGLRSINNLDHQTKEASIGRWFNGLNKSDSTEGLNIIWNELKTCDLLIIGGEPFIEISLGLYRGPAPYASLLITLAKLLGKPVMINGIHIGRPLHTLLGKETARYCISNADLVTLREENSVPLIKEFGIENMKHIYTFADAAYGIDRIDDLSVGQSVFDKEGIKFKNKNIIGITFRHMYWKWSNDVWGEYSSIVSNLCDYIIENYKSDIIFIPHNTYEFGNKYENDLPAHADIYKKVKNKENAHLINNRYSVREMISIFPHLKMIFSNRRHSLIFGAIHDVPGLGVGEKLHVQVTMEELGIGKKLFVDIEDFDIDIIKNNLDNIWKNKDVIIEREKEVLPILRQRALRHAESAANLIKN